MRNLIDDVMVSISKKTDYQPTEYPGINAPPPEFDPRIEGISNFSGVLVSVDKLDAEAAIELEYWAGEMTAGKWRWKESVAQIAKRHAISTSAVVDIVLGSSSVAHDLSARCPKSGYPQELKNRTAMRTRAYQSCTCPRCTWDNYTKLPHVAEEYERKRATAILLDMIFGVAPESLATSTATDTDDLHPRLTDEEIKAKLRILELARLDGYKGKCMYAAVAINEMLFGGEGQYVTISNRAYAEKGLLYGHVVVDFGGHYWDSRGIVPPNQLEIWGWADADELAHIGIFDLSLTKQVEIQSFPEVYPSPDEREICDLFVKNLREAIQTLKENPPQPNNFKK